MNKFTIGDFKGVIPATLTNFDKDENLDEKGIREFVRFLLKFDIGGLYLTGSTGETFLMQPKERKRCVEIVMEEAGGKVPVVVHTGAMATKTSIELAKHAKDNGATGISSVPPFYWHFTNEQIFKYYEDIATSTDIPLIIYNIPLAGLMGTDMILKLSGIENIKGLKYTGSQLFELQEIREKAKDDFLLYGGMDEQASSNLLIGVDGIIGSFYNIIPDLYIKIFNSAKKLDVNSANKYQVDALHLIEYVLNQGSMMGAIKSCLRGAGINAGYSRRPFTNFLNDEQDRICKGLVEVAVKNNINDVYIINELINKY